MNIKITKANSNGNSFILINNIPNKLLISNKQISDICKFHKTDGLIILNSTNINDISMNYYNNDGLWETLCANGLICATKLLHTLCTQNKFNISCGGKGYEIQKKDTSIEIRMPKPVYKSGKILLENIEGYYIDSGAKHFIINQKNSWPSNDDIITISQKVRYNTKLFPNGINVNFYKIINDNTLEIKTYEKGIENLMRSCASGSFACAFHFHKNSNAQSLINIINPGGKYLSVFKNNYKNNYIISNSIIEYQDNVSL